MCLMDVSPFPLLTETDRTYQIWYVIWSVFLAYTACAILFNVNYNILLYSASFLERTFCAVVCWPDATPFHSLHTIWLPGFDRWTKVCRSSQPGDTIAAGRSNESVFSLLHEAFVHACDSHVMGARPFLNHIKAKLRKRDREDQEEPAAPKPPKVKEVKQEPARTRRKAWVSSELLLWRLFRCVWGHAFHMFFIHSLLLKSFNQTSTTAPCCCFARPTATVSVNPGIHAYLYRGSARSNGLAWDILCGWWNIHWVSATIQTEAQQWKICWV